MGVKGLWNLLEPVGRRVNIEAIANKRLAIDASIWLFQFMKAMRDERGDMMRNAHLLGFFRRICRLLFHRVRPVFVFDGATPALKRHTNIARRRRREAQQGVLRKAAEKMLIAQLKKQALHAAKAQQQQEPAGQQGSGSRVGKRPPVPAGPAAEVLAAARVTDGRVAGAGISGVTAVASVVAGPEARQPGSGAGPSGLNAVPLDSRAWPSNSGAGLFRPLHLGVSNCDARADDVIDVEDAVTLRRLEKGKTPMSREEEAAWLASKAARQRSPHLDPDSKLKLDDNDGGSAHEDADDVDEEAMMDADEALARKLDRDLNRPQRKERPKEPHPQNQQQKRQPRQPYATSAAVESVGKAGGTGAYGSAEDWKGITAVPEVYTEAHASGDVEDVEALDPTAGMCFDPNANCYVPHERQRKNPADAAAAVTCRPNQRPDLDDRGYTGDRAVIADGGGVDGDGDEDEELISSMMALPEDLSSIDPAVLSTLPTSLQLDILEKIRDAQMAANREKFQVAARVRPENFCEVQMATYLRASAFRQQLEEYKQNLGGGGTGQGADGMQARKVMSEEGREYILAMEQSQPSDKRQQQQRCGGLFGGGGGGRRGGSGKVDQLLVAAAAQAAQRNIGLPLRLNASIPLAAFKGLTPPPASATVSDTVETTTMPASSSWRGSKAEGCSGGGGAARSGGCDASRMDVVEEVVARCAVLELQLSDTDTGNNDSARGMFSSSSGGNDSGDDVEDGNGSSVQVAGVKDSGRLPLGVEVLSSRGGGGTSAATSTAAASSAAVLDDVEWEDVAAEEAAPSVAAATVALTNARPRDWRERMASRQKLWSTSHGFRMGRKLADWGGKGANPLRQRGGEPGDATRGSMGRRSARGDGEGAAADAVAMEEEEEQDPLLQEAIRESLQPQQQHQQPQPQMQQMQRPDNGGKRIGNCLGGKHRAHDKAGDLDQRTGSGEVTMAAMVAGRQGPAEGSIDGPAEIRMHQPLQPPMTSKADVDVNGDDGFEWEDVDTPMVEVSAIASVSLALQKVTHESSFENRLPRLGLPKSAAVAAVGGGGSPMPLVPRRGPLAAVVGAERPADGSAAAVTIQVPSAAPTRSPGSVSDGEVIWEATDADLEHLEMAMMPKPAGKTTGVAAPSGRAISAPPACGLDDDGWYDGVGEPVAACEAPPGYATKRLLGLPPLTASVRLPFAATSTAAAVTASAAGDCATTATAVVTAAAAGDGAAADGQWSIHSRTSVSQASVVVGRSNLISRINSSSSQRLQEVNPGCFAGTPPDRAVATTAPHLAEERSGADSSDSEGDFDFGFVDNLPVKASASQQVELTAAAATAAAINTAATHGGLATAGTHPVSTAVPPAGTASGAASPTRPPAAAIAAGTSASVSEDLDFEFDFVEAVPSPAVPPPLPPVPANMSAGTRAATASPDQLLHPLGPALIVESPREKGLLQSPHQPRIQPEQPQQLQSQLQQPYQQHTVQAHPLAAPSSATLQCADLDLNLGAAIVHPDDDAGEEAADDADWFDEDPDYVPSRDRNSVEHVRKATRVMPPPSQQTAEFAAAAPTFTATVDTIPYHAFLPPSHPPGTWLAPMLTRAPPPPPPLQGAPSAPSVGSAPAVAMAVEVAPLQGPRAAGGSTAASTIAAAAEGPTLDELLEEVEAEEQELRSVQARASRNLEAPTPEMYQECQELLQMFGLPFIVAPMEAEAQCAYLEIAGLVDGVVTDDNDVFLFGGRHVYRHIFENKKYVEEYVMSDVEREMGLTRERLVEMALLLGSDYTEGCGGIGIVNAVEVVHAFPGQLGLQRFRSWVESPDVGIAVAARQLAGEEAGEGDAHPDDTPAQRQFKREHRAVRKNWQLPASFPADNVMEAYLQPRLDPNNTKFTFGRPDMQLLRQFCSDKFCWTSDKVDELLVPVLKEYDNRQAQLRMEQFLSFSTRFAKIRSKRLQTAVAKITGHEPVEELVLGNAVHLAPSRHGKGGESAADVAAAAAAGGYGEAGDRVEGNAGEHTHRGGVVRRQKRGPGTGAGKARGRGKRAAATATVAASENATAANIAAAAEVEGDNTSLRSNSVDEVHGDADGNGVKEYGSWAGQGCGRGDGGTGRHAGERGEHYGGKVKAMGREEAEEAPCTRRRAAKAGTVTAEEPSPDAAAEADCVDAVVMAVTARDAVGVPCRKIRKRGRTAEGSALSTGPPGAAGALKRRKGSVTAPTVVAAVSFADTAPQDATGAIALVDSPNWKEQ